MWRDTENASWARMEHLRGSPGYICDTRLSADDQRLRERPGADSPSWPQKKPTLQMPSAKISAPGLGVNKFLLFSAAQSHWFLFSPQGSVLRSLCLYSSSLKRSHLASGLKSCLQTNNPDSHASSLDLAPKQDPYNQLPIWHPYLESPSPGLEFS